MPSRDDERPAARTAFGRRQKVAVLLPLAMISSAWTLSLASVSGAADEDEPRVEVMGTLPDGSQMPTEAFDAPASVSTTTQVKDSRHVVRSASVQGIPAAALAAYQRAETVINAADKSCHLPWQLVAAIGRVESDHGRFGGNVLDADGVARPGIVGIPLDGRNGTATIADSDAGELDGDTRWDRAVGPMQFIPATWRMVGVDSDGDGDRNPQDIDDAALATAVYLCSGKEDLSTEDGQRAAVFRYNHSEQYVDLVLSIMHGYLAGDFMSVPNYTTTTTIFTPGEGYQPPGAGDDDHDAQQGQDDGPGGQDTTDPGTDDPTQVPDPTDPGTDDSGPDVPTSLPTVDPSDVTEPVEETTEDVLTLAEALVQCAAEGVVDNPLTTVNELKQCAERKLKG